MRVLPLLVSSQVNDRKSHCCRARSFSASALLSSCHRYPVHRRLTSDTEASRAAWHKVLSLSASATREIRRTLDQESLPALKRALRVGSVRNLRPTRRYSKLCKSDVQLELAFNFLRSCIREYLRIGVPGCFICNVLNPDIDTLTFSASG